MDTEQIETVIIGGGQAGLATSYHLGRRGHEHVVLEQASQAGSAWRDGRWDSFTLVTPNWSFGLPGAEFAGDDPDGFMPRDQIVQRFEHYVTEFALPVRFGVRASSVRWNADGKGYTVATDTGEIQTASVVVASGLFQRPKVPEMAADFPEGVQQLHSGQYRNPAQLPDGAVLVVGSAQSGCQIAQELYRSGRTVYLCIGSAGRVPRRYRGRDIFDWMNRSGFLDRTVADLPSPRAKFAGNPHVSGRDGGQNLNLHQFARDGVVLLGHLRSVEGKTISLAPDRDESLRKADAFEATITDMVDRYIHESGDAAPLEELPALRDGFLAEELLDLDLASAGVTSLIWATGYEFDFRLIKLPVVDSDGYPLQHRGVTSYPGLYFVGMPWLDKWKSGLLIGVGDHADFIASEIADRGPR